MYGCYKAPEIRFPAQPFTSWLCSCISRNLDLLGFPLKFRHKDHRKNHWKNARKDTELQYLHSQLMYGDMLNPTTEVQFNLNPKQHLSHFGADVTASDKGKQLVFAFKEGRHTKEYSYPDNYQDLKEAQIEALKEGVKEGKPCFKSISQSNVWTFLKKLSIGISPILLHDRLDIL